MSNIDFDNIEIINMKKAMRTILITHYDDFYSFLDDYSTGWLFELKTGGIDKLLSHKYNPDVVPDILEKFLDEHDLFGELATEIRENEEDKEVQRVNSEEI